MNNEENHGFTSFDFITIMVSFAIIVAVTAPIIKKNMQTDQTLERARIETTELGKTLRNPGKLAQLSGDSGYLLKTNRSIASLDVSNDPVRFDLQSIKDHLKKGEMAGDLGKDPWGRPYHFSFLKNPAGMTTHVVVWSDGPNNKNETNVQQATLNDKAGIEFKGDDLGSVIPLR